MKKTIFVHDISSIKHNHFSFKNKKKEIIKDFPFVIKKIGKDSYHFDEEDLMKLSKYEKDLAPHDDSDKLSRNEYIKEMKEEFFHQIRSGNMDELLTHLYKLESKDIELKWGGSIEHEFK